MNEKETLMLSLLLIGVILSGCLSSNPNKTPNEFPHDEQTPHRLFEQYAAKSGTTIEQTMNFFKEVYGVSEEKEIFAALPTKPHDFEEKKQALHDGNGAALLELDPSVYLLPEFYPTFLTSGLKTWINAPNQPVQTIGVGGTPGDQIAHIPTPDGEFITTLFVTSSWGSTHYQGMKLAYTIEPDANITLTFEPENLVVGPTFPVFSEEWAQKVIIRGKMENVKEGTYHITLYPDTPNPAQSNEWAQSRNPYVQYPGPLSSAEGIGTLTLERKNQP